MAEAKHLQVVKAGAKAPRRRVMSVTKAAREGTARDLLVAMRDRIAKDVESPNTLARDLAALTRRLMEISKEIDAIDAREAEEGNLDGELPDDDAFDASAI